MKTMFIKPDRKKQRSNQHDLLFSSLTEDEQAMMSGGIVIIADGEEIQIIKTAEVLPNPYSFSAGLSGLGFLGFPYLNYNHSLL